MKIRMLVAVALIFALFLILPDVGQSASKILTPDQVLSPEKSVTEYGGYVFVLGRWKKTLGNSTFSNPPRINTVSISCNPQTMICEEIIAGLVTQHEMGSLDKPLLVSTNNSYRIIDWKNNIIRAVYAAFVADFELRISVKDKAVERRWRETKARGSETSDPKNYQNWILE
jgi:hypothetical protein